ncbi:sensor domain-containing diguanylate cyclase [Pseudorhodoferax sp. Leaf267]|uniref:sensor domain-containing diguanylate cyclase n=1 Tax=Pseudorhodoferax sp. Leaf267 TaxID=1736316 RepID=UPI000A6751B0|nr:sensor domain-containing diguanylate cyclase [Pseudorhodoferax sp. Leaf267]
MSQGEPPEGAVMLPLGTDDDAAPGLADAHAPTPAPAHAPQTPSFGQAPLPRTQRLSLLETLQRAHVRVAAASMGAVALVLLLAAVLALRTYATNHLELVARSIAYTVEAAVVFNDRQAIQEQLTAIAQRESLRDAELLDASGTVLARYTPQGGTAARDVPGIVGDQLAALLMPGTTVAPILDQGRTIGELRLHGDGSVFARFLATAVGGILLCLVLLGLGMRASSRRMRRDIVEPVEALIAMTHVARAQRVAAQRAPASRIAEFHQLGEDFNALLTEIESQQAQLAQENRSLTHLANHDSLTGLYNRAFFSRRLARILQDAQTQGSSIAVLYMDNDQFKGVNDRYGHAVGDLLLVEVAKRIRAQLREGDLVARLGGDEFAVLLAPVHHVRDAVRIADKITASMDTPLPARSERIVPSVSIGIAVYPLHGHSADQLLRAADRAMYQAKKTRRGTSHVFQDPPQTPTTNEIPEL